MYLAMQGYFRPHSGLPRNVSNMLQKAKLAKYSRFYFVCGDAESDNMVADMKKMADMIRAKGVSEQNYAQ